jgi:hypothetical protein
MEVALRPSATLGSRLAEFRDDEALLLQAFQGGIDAAEFYVAVGELLDFTSDRNAIGVVAETENHEHDDELEVGEIGGGGHIFNYDEEIARKQGVSCAARLEDELSGSERRIIKN